VWQEKKTGRGTKITGRLVTSPLTPKVKKLSTPRSKRRRLGRDLTPPDLPDEEDPPLEGPIPIRLPQVNKRGGKVILSLCASEAVC